MNLSDSQCTFVVNQRVKAKNVIGQALLRDCKIGQPSTTRYYCICDYLDLPPGIHAKVRTGRVYLINVFLIAGVLEVAAHLT
jgi:hypothetical protein